MTRASHMLCLAVHKDSIQGHENELKQNGWEFNIL